MNKLSNQFLEENSSAIKRLTGLHPSAFYHLVAASWSSMLVFPVVNMGSRDLFYLGIIGFWFFATLASQKMGGFAKLLATTCNNGIGGLIILIIISGGQVVTIMCILNIFGYVPLDFIFKETGV